MADRMMQSKTTNASAIQQEEGFHRIDETLRRFIEALNQDYTKIVDLLGHQTKTINEHTTESHHDTQVVIAEQSRETQRELQESMRKQAEQTEKARVADTLKSETEKFLRSLKYPRMNERYTSLNDAAPRTFEWLFGDVGTSSDDDDKDPFPRYVVQSMKKTWNRFPEWIASDSSSYWITGKAGSGKSTLMKFLLHDPRTQRLLNDKEGKEVLILAHFVWISGTDKQRSVAGLLASLLHSLCAKRGDLVGGLLEKFTVILSHDVDTDWSESSLEDVLFHALQPDIIRQKCCIFIDGLDEVHVSDGPRKLLLLMDRLRNIPGIRLCVASRPGRVFEDWLSAWPRLQLQDLTAADIWHLATDSINKSFDKTLSRADSLSSEKTRWQVEQLVQMILWRSDGVILWVILAVRSIDRGRTNGDSWATLEARLDTMPRDLHELYASMWNRLNDDRDIYRNEASEIFNLVLTWQSIFERSVDFLEDAAFHLLTFCLAWDEDKTTQVIENISAINIGALGQQCTQAAQMISSRCAGLLELHPPHMRCNVDGEAGEFHVELSFVHRTAREFLLDTPEGQRIMECARSSREDWTRRVLVADAARLKLFPEVCSQRHQCAAAWSTMWDILCRTENQKDILTKSTLQSLLPLYQQVYDCGAGYSPGLLGLLGESFELTYDFLGLAVGAGFHDYLEKRLSGLPTVSQEYLDYLGLCCNLPNVSWHDCSQNKRVLRNFRGLWPIARRCEREHGEMTSPPRHQPPPVPSLFRGSSFSTFLNCLVSLDEEAANDVGLCNELVLILRDFGGDEETLMVLPPYIYRPHLYLPLLQTPSIFQETHHSGTSLVFGAKYSTLVCRLAEIHQRTILGKVLREELSSLRTTKAISLPNPLLLYETRLTTHKGFKEMFVTISFREVPNEAVKCLQELLTTTFAFNERDKWADFANKDVRTSLNKIWQSAMSSGHMEGTDSNDWWGYLSQRGYLPLERDFKASIANCTPPMFQPDH
jgi:hypothetical protein